jgi:hypothetical protein
MVTRYTGGNIHNFKTALTILLVGILLPTVLGTAAAVSTPFANQEGVVRRLNEKHEYVSILLPDHTYGIVQKPAHSAPAAEFAATQGAPSLLQDQAMQDHSPLALLSEIEKLAAKADATKIQHLKQPPSYKDALCARETKTKGPRIALAFYGLIRDPATFESIERHIYKPLHDAGIEFDVFVHAMFLPELTNARSKEKHEPLNPYSVVLLNPCVFEISAQFEVRETLFKKYQSMGERGNPWQADESNFESVKNLLCALHSQERVATLISEYSKQHNFEYDSVVLLRPDLAYPTDIDTHQIRALQATDNIAYTDTWQSQGYISDRYMFGGSRMMLNTIMTRIWRWAEENSTGEKFLKSVFVKEEIQRKNTMMPVLRIRANGKVHWGDANAMREVGFRDNDMRKIAKRCIGPDDFYTEAC